MSSSIPLCIALASAGCDPEAADPAGVDADVAAGPRCVFDEDDEPAAATALDGEARGALCPVQDRDWYAFSVPSGDRLVTVELSMDSPISPVEPTYEIRAADGAAVAAPAADEVGAGLSVRHCLAPGAYRLAVRDSGDDAQDLRNGYTLRVQTAPDPDGAEPNDGEGAATALRPGQAASGVIACRGDADWHVIEAGERQILRYVFELPVAELEPRVRVIGADGTVLDDRSAPAARREATRLERAVMLPGAGPVFVVVGDDDGRDGDPAAAYRLTVALDDEADVNEPNNDVRTATALPALNCGDGWTGWVEVQGTVGTVGDPDWFRLPLEGCDPGVIEAEMAFDGAPAAGVEAAVAVVRPHGDSPCAADADCRSLNRDCSSGWDCVGLGNVCQADGRCAGATTCLPEGTCGAFLIDRRYTPSGAAGEVNRALVSAPLRRDPSVYLRLGDYAGDARDAARFYTLRVRVRRDPDGREPSDAYSPVRLRSDPVGPQLQLARERNVVPVHGCILREPPVMKGGPMDAAVEDMAVDASVDMGPEDMGSEDMAAVDMTPVDMAPDMAPEDMTPVDMTPVDMAPEDMAPMDMAPVDMAAPEDMGPGPDENGVVPGCCGPGDWIEGALSYDGDQDWYAYRHPCPGQDCTVRIRYEIDGGSVDPLWQVFRGDSLWFDTVVPVDEVEANPARSGAFGGVEAGDQCFYAYNGHTARGGDPFWYYLSVRDLLPAVDWDPDQRYRFCIEKVAEFCAEPPCRVYERGGCGVPE